MSAVNDLTGRVFSRLTVIHRNGSDKRGRAMWFCRCECNRTITTKGNALLSGLTRSCGHHYSGHKPIHGASGTPAFRSWTMMRHRCANPDEPLYFGRVLICERWQQSFLNFLADMGPRPPGTTLDRIDTNGHYTPENCRWATPVEQAFNSRRTWHFRTLDDQELSLSGVARYLALQPAFLWRQFRASGIIGEAWS